MAAESNYQTPEEMEQKYIEIMGDHLGRLFYALWNEVVHLYRIWAQYVILYGTKPSRVDILNDTASSFFRIVQDSLWEQTILGVARLTDRARTGQKENLTIQQLSAAISDPSLACRVVEAIDEAIKRSEFCRDWRNRRIAHRDLYLSIEKGILPLKPGSREGVNNALKAVADVLNVLSAHYIKAELVFDAKWSVSGGAEELLYVLDDGLRERQRRRERRRRREYVAEDNEIRDL
jgi:AbiU2